MALSATRVASARSRTASTPAWTDVACPRSNRGFTVVSTCRSTSADAIARPRGRRRPPAAKGRPHGAFDRTLENRFAVEGGQEFVLRAETRARIGREQHSGDGGVAGWLWVLDSLRSTTGRSLSRVNPVTLLYYRVRDYLDRVTVQEV